MTAIPIGAAGRRAGHYGSTALIAVILLMIALRCVVLPVALSLVVPGLMIVVVLGRGWLCAPTIAACARSA